MNQLGQLELDAISVAFGAILGHLLAGGPRTLQAMAINIMTGSSCGFYSGPWVCDYFNIAPGRPSCGVGMAIAVIGALVVPTLLMGLRPWTERNTDNLIGRLAGRVVGMLGPLSETKEEKKP